MSAIYQRARPIRWDQVVGQEHVKDVLKAALEAGRVGHAYLFSGPRGVGKTTTARLIAMTANCTGPAPKPCGECESCLSVRAGSHPDVLEIDAASNNGVDDVRDLREKVGLAAMRGGKKIYILDEAHMMTKAAFNALLKTLEEPPGHVIFILATTEPEKIIPTILSRCQHYRFRRLTPEEIAGKLAGLATQEGMTAEPEALNLIGRLADGAMRDGESLLERMLAAGSVVTRAGVEEALGLPPGERVRAVAAALVAGDAGVALQGAGQLYRDGFAARTVVEGLVSALGAALHAELGLGGERLEGADVPRLLKLQAALDEQEARFARSADGQSLELALTHALLAVDGSGGGVMLGGAVSGGAMSGRAVSGGEALPPDLLQRLNRLEKELAELRTGREFQASMTEITQSVGASKVDAAESAPKSIVVREDQKMFEAINASNAWETLLTTAHRISGQQMRAFMKEGRYEVRDNGIYIVFDRRDKKGKPVNKFHGDSVIRNAAEIEKAVKELFGSVSVTIDNFGELKRIAQGSRQPVSRSAPPLEAHPVPTLDGETEDRTAQTDSPPIRTSTQAVPAAEIEVAPFDPAPRRASRGPEGPQESASFAVPAPSAQTTPLQTALPPRPSTVATLDAPPPRPQTRPTQTQPTQTQPTQTQPPEIRLPRPASPDDVAPAPLPEVKAAPWASGHVADPPPIPADALGGDLVTPPGPTPPRAPRELYVVEAITEEPDWDDIGGPVEDAGPPSLDDAPYASLAVERPASAPQPQPQSPQPQSLQPPQPTASAAPSRPGDIRAHPMYEEIKDRFSGRVREIGKNRNPVAPATVDDEEGEGAEA